MITRGSESSHGIEAINPRISIPILASVFFAMLAVMGILSVSASTQNSFAGDVYLTRNFQSVPTPYWLWAMETASFISNGPILVMGAFVLLSKFLYRRQTAEYMLVVAGIVSTPLALGLKMVVGREQSSAEAVDVWKHLGGLSFPSGHASTAVIAFDLLFYLAPILTNNKHIVSALRAGSVAMIACHGFT